MSYPQPAVGSIAPGFTKRSAVPTDSASAKLVILSALQSGAGLTRLTTQSGTVAEVGALALLTASSDAIGTAAAAILDNANIGGTPIAGFVALTFESTWGELVTAVAAS